MARDLESGWPWDLSQLRREMDEMLQRFGGERGAVAGTPYPPVNLYETAESYVLTAEIPGVGRDDLAITVEDRRLTLRGERRIEIPDDGRTSVHRRERQPGIFRRSVELPTPVDADGTRAQYRDGVLVIQIAKAASHQPRRISVQGA